MKCATLPYGASDLVNGNFNTKRMQVYLKTKTKTCLRVYIRQKKVFSQIEEQDCN